MSYNEYNLGKDITNAFEARNFSQLEHFLKMQVEPSDRLGIRGYRTHAINNCLRAACEKGLCDYVQLFLDHGGLVNSSRRNGPSLASFAAKRGHLECLRLLIRHGANVRAAMDNALILACDNKHIDCVVELIQAGCDPTVRHDYPIRWMAQHGHLDALEMIIQRGVPVDLEDLVTHTAINSEYYQFKRIMLRFGGDRARINVNCCGGLFLSKAVKNNDLEFMRFLLDLGANPNLGDPLVIAWEKKYWDAAMLLVESGGRITGQANHLLVRFASVGDLANIQQLVAAGGNVNFNDGAAATFAAAHGHLPCLHYLVSEGFDVRLHGGQPLIAAASTGNIDCLQFLIDKGANVNANHDSALEIAYSNGHFKCMSLLLNCGAKFHADNYTFLEMACRNSNLEIIDYLLELGSNIRHDSDIAILWAISSGKIECLKHVLQRGAKVDSRIQECCKAAISLKSGQMLNIILSCDRAAHYDKGMLDKLLVAAAASGNLLCMKVLIGRGADFGQDYFACLKSAMWQFDTVGVEFILSHGGNKLLSNQIRELAAIYYDPKCQPALRVLLCHHGQFDRLLLNRFRLSTEMLCHMAAATRWVFDSLEDRKQFFDGCPKKFRDLSEIICGPFTQLVKQYLYAPQSRFMTERLELNYSGASDDDDETERQKAANLRLVRDHLISRVITGCSWATLEWLLHHFSRVPHTDGSGTHDLVGLNAEHINRNQLICRLPTWVLGKIILQSYAYL